VIERSDLEGHPAERLASWRQSAKEIAESGIIERKVVDRDRD
jgi:hypothetical protein